MTNASEVEPTSSIALEYMNIYRKFIIIISIAFTLCLPKSIHAKSIRILNLTAEIYVDQDASLLVREIHTVKFIGQYGYYRWNIRCEKPDKISNIVVYDGEANLTEQNKVTIRQGYSGIRVWADINAEDEERKLKIEYKVREGIQFMKKHNNVTWSVITGERGTPTENLQVFLYLPTSVDVKKLKPRVLFGKAGSEVQLNNFEVLNGRSVRYWGENIGPYQRFIISLDLPKGIFNKDRWLILMPYLWFVIPLITSASFISMWFEKQKVRRHEMPVITRYEPPEGLSPLEMNILVSQNSVSDGIVATLIDLASRGYLKIVEYNKRTIRGVYSVYNLEKQETFNEHDKLKRHEQMFLEGIFNSQDTINVADLKQKIRSIGRAMITSAVNGLIKDGYFKTNLKRMINRPKRIAILFLSIGMLSLAFSINTGLAFITSSAILFLFKRVQIRETPKGSETKKHILEFRNFLSMNEEFHEVNGLHLDVLDSYFAYAVSLRVEDKWINRFAEIPSNCFTWFDHSEDPSEIAVYKFLNLMRRYLGPTVEKAL